MKSGFNKIWSCLVFVLFYSINGRNSAEIIQSRQEEIETISPEIKYNDYKTYHDFVTLSTLSNFTEESEFNVDVEFYLKEYNNFHIYGGYTDSFGKQTLFYQYSFQENSSSIDRKNEQGKRSLVVKIPNDMIYFNHQNNEFPTNYFVDHIQIKAKLVLSDLFDNTIVTSVDEDLLNITLPAPWDRLQLPEYCLSWWLHNYNLYINSKRIPTCDILQNPSVFPGLLPISGKSNGGFIKKVSNLNWPKHIPHHHIQEVENTAVYTISFWLFLTSKCTKGGCFVLQQRNVSNFHGIIILHNERGELHIQLHDKNGNGQAFTSRPLPLYTWTSVIIKINNNHAELYLRFQEDTQYLSFNGHFNFAYGGNHSFWVIGGYFVSHGFSGYLAKMTVNHFTLLNYKHYERHFFEKELKELANLIPKKVYKRCNAYHRLFRSIVYSDLKHKQSMSYPFVDLQDLLKVCLSTEGSKLKKRRFAHQQALEEELVKLKTNMGEQYPLKEEFGSFIFDSVMKNITKQIATPLSMLLLEFAGCLGYSKSYFTLATFYKYGINIEENAEKAYMYHLLASQQNDALSMLALAYRYQLNLDGLKYDVAVQAGFVRQAAVIAKHVLDSEKHEIDTHSELVRLDQAHSLRDVRGRSSELFKWIAQQASMGSIEAKNQMADMLFHGKQGVDANRALAVEHFEDLAQLGDPAAMVNLAVIHLKGVNVEKNITKAKEWLQKSVQKNSSFAFNVLGFLEVHYNDNMTAAIEFWKKGVEAGDLQCMYNYASVMEQMNHTEAVKYYEEGAGKGERHSCFRLADLLVEGISLPRNEGRAVNYYQYIAEQNEDIGRFMRNAINDYLDGNRYASYLNHLFAMESGLKLAGYNIALLLKEIQNEQEHVSPFTTIHNPIYYINFTAELGWSTSLKEMGDESLLVKNDSKEASLYYTRAIKVNNHPEAFYNLAYIIEHALPLGSSLMINDLSLPWQLNGNLTLAGELLKSCMASESEDGDGYYPCQLVLYKIQVKWFLQEYILSYLHLYEGVWIYFTSVVVTLLLIGVGYGLVYT